MDSDLNHSIRFEVLGEPVPKARHRTARTRTGMLIQYNDKQAKAREGNFQAQAVRFAPSKPITGAVRLEISAFMKIPQSWSKKKTLQALAGEIRPTKKPDFDNLAKFVGDALNGIFWLDDKQIVAGLIVKQYSDRPRWEIKVRW